MNTQNAAGYLLVAGFVLIIVASFVITSRVYETRDTEERLSIIADNQGGWKASNIIWMLASLTTGAGVFYLARDLRGTVNDVLLISGAGIFCLGAVSWAIFLYQRMVDPVNFFKQATLPPLLFVYVWATTIGLLLLGLVFLQTGYSSWFGYLTLGLMGLVGVGLIFFRSDMIASFPPQMFYLITLIAGILELRR